MLGMAFLVQEMRSRIFEENTADHTPIQLLRRHRYQKHLSIVSQMMKCNQKRLPSGQAAAIMQSLLSVLISRAKRA